MNRLLFLFKVLFLFCVIPQVCHAQVNFSASVYPEKIGKDEYTTLRLTVENGTDVQQVRPPSLKDFRVISGPNQESGMSSVNGVVKQYISLSYVLQPLKKGLFTISKASAVIDGRPMSTRPLSLTVVEGSANGKGNRAYSSPPARQGFDPFEEERPSTDYQDYILRKGENIPEKINKNMMLRLVTDKTSCYVGEPIIASYKLYTRLKSDSKLTKNPSFNGFSVIDLQAQTVTGFSQEAINGRAYNVYTIRKTQLYPLQAGQVNLEAAAVENNVQFVKEGTSSSGRGIFDDLVGPPGEVINQTVTLTSKPVSITVKELPDVGKPAGFSGAVGEFTISSQVNKSGFSTDDAGSLQVTISGAGNMHLINAPEIIWPEGIDGFDPKSTDKYNNMVVPLQGDKIFDYNFSVQRAGDYTIPAIKFSFFNPATGLYKTVTTQAHKINITEGKNPVKKTISNFSDADADSPDYLSYAWYALAAIALLGIVVVLAGKKKKKVIAAETEELSPSLIHPVEETQTPVDKEFIFSQHPLQETEGCLEKDECIDFYGILNKELKHFLALRFSLNESVINSKKIIAAMDSSGIDNHTVLKLQQLMQEIEWRLYTPFERTYKLQDLYSRSMQVIQEINTAMLAHTTP